MAKNRRHNLIAPSEVPEKRKGAKQQIKGLLLQHGIEGPKSLLNFSKAGIAELKSIELCDELRFCIDSLIDELSYFESKIKETEKHMGNHLKKTLLNRITTC
jgi:hypothetical protein